MKIAIVGSGALGLYYGALLQRAGNEVCFLLRRDYEAIKSAGLMIYSINGDFHLPEVQGFLSTGEIGEVDLVLVGLKTYSNHLFRDLISPLVGNNTLILTLQNGLGNEEALADLFGGERILGGVAHVRSCRGLPGVVHHLGEGRVIIGEYTPANGTSSRTISSLFQMAQIDCRPTQDLKKTRWEKLVWNIPFNGLCSLLLSPVAALLAHTAMRQLIRDIMEEVIGGGNSQELLKEIPLSLTDRMINFSADMGDYKPSMLLDRLDDRELELESIFGNPLIAAHAKGVQMPRVQELYALLQFTESSSSKLRFARNRLEVVPIISAERNSDD